MNRECKKLFIGGRWIETANYMPLYSPFGNRLLAEIPEATIENADHAMIAAKQGFERMARLHAYDRAEILYKVSQLIHEQREECARIIAEEAGKPIKTARTEIDRTVQTYLVAAEEAKRIHGETVPLDAAKGGEGRVAYTQRRPIGVILAITPFNFPFNLVAHKVGPAIASGNSVVLKPSEQTPLSAFKLAEIFKAAGLPNGALNVITGDGRKIGNYLVKHQDVKMVTFTGSFEVGEMIQANAGMKRTTLELGSNAAVIIDEHIPLADLSKIAKKCVIGAFAYAGQVCISLQRIYIHEKLIDPFTEHLKKEIAKLKIGDPLLEDTDISSLIRPQEEARIHEWIGDAINDGAMKVTGGYQQNCILPTLLTNVSRKSKLNYMEAFGPVVILNAFSSFDEALIAVNDSPYGLQAGVYTNHLEHAFKATEKLDVGGVMINDIPTFRVDHMPYGGLKNSGVGREGVKYAIEEMTELKLVSFKTVI